MSTSELEVLIVGAGPTGLIAAAELGARGVRCRLIDKALERSDKSRALVIHPRSLELLSKMGALSDLLEVGQKSTSINLHVNGKRVASADIDDVGFTDTPFPFLLFVSQAETERVLEAHAERYGVRVERGLTLVSLQQDDGGVTAELEGPQGRERVRARYVVGADGAHSAVRTLSGLSFEGDAYPQDFILADVDIDWEYPAGGVHLFFSESGVFVCLPMHGQKAWRLITVRERGDAGLEPTLDEFRWRAENGGPVPGTFSNPRWLARFRLHHRGVDRYRDRRVFVAGDAAHIHSPVGGQGMNTGIQDAFNLGWKLALVVRHGAPEALLDSYHLERYPVGQKLLDFTDQLFRLGSSDNWAVAKARRLGVPSLGGFALNRKSLRGRAFKFVSQLGIRYLNSPLSREPKRRGTLAKAPRAGNRAPDAKLGGSTVHAQLKGPGFHLLCFGVTDQTAIAKAIGDFEPLVRPVFVDEPEAFTRYGVGDAGLMLVRPDGYLATRTAGVDPAPVRAWLLDVLGP